MGCPEGMCNEWDYKGLLLEFPACLKNLSDPSNARRSALHGTTCTLPVFIRALDILTS